MKLNFKLILQKTKTEIRSYKVYILTWNSNLKEEKRREEKRKVYYYSVPGVCVLIFAKKN